jgi:hypothetical protein
MCIDKADNELVALEIMHLFCVVLDSYFGNVCELDIIYNFDKAYLVLDELFLSGIAQQDEQLVNEIMEEAMLA